MSARAIRTEDKRRPRSAVNGLDGHTVEAARRVVATSAGSQAGQCTCPEDCERDHPNE